MSTDCDCSTYVLVEESNLQNMETEEKDDGLVVLPYTFVDYLSFCVTSTDAGIRDEPTGTYYEVE